MSSDKQRRARQRAEREDWERDQRRLAKGRRRRLSLVVTTAVVAVVSLVVVAVSLDEGDDPSPRVSEPRDRNTAALDEEVLADAQASAAAEAMAAGAVMAEDYTIQPGAPISSGQVPARKDRPVACGEEPPDNVGAIRPRYPGGPLQVLEDGVDYVAVIKTSCGSMTVDLLEEDAPVAVNSFVFLSKAGFYDGLEFFRDFGAVAAVQAGSGNNLVDWDIGYRLPDELDVAKREGYPVGTLTTVGTGPYTAGSQFSIVYGTAFDAGYQTNRNQTAFGKVLKGMDVIETMTAMDRVGLGGEAFEARLFMQSVTIVER